MLKELFCSFKWHTCHMEQPSDSLGCLYTGEIVSPVYYRGHQVMEMAWCCHFLGWHLGHPVFWELQRGFLMLSTRICSTTRVQEYLFHKIDSAEVQGNIYPGPAFLKKYVSPSSASHSGVTRISILVFTDKFLVFPWIWWGYTWLDYHQVQSD